MFCPKCGEQVEEGKKVCPNCDLVFDTISSSQTNKKLEVSEITDEVSSSLTGAQQPLLKILFFALAIIVLVMFFMAASSISKGGMEIMQIQSVGGKTLEEAYYAELGNIYAGYAMISRGLGIFFASVLVWLGLKR